MPDNFDDEQINNMSIDDINELYEDTIETPDEYTFRIAISDGRQCSVYSYLK